MYEYGAILLSMNVPKPSRLRFYITQNINNDSSYLDYLDYDCIIAIRSLSTYREIFADFPEFFGQVSRQKF